MDLLQSRLNRSRSSTPSTHCRFATEESSESTKNSRASKNVSPSQVETLKTASIELRRNLKSLHKSVFDIFEQLLPASLQASFRKIDANQCDSANYIDLNGQRVTDAPRGRVLAAFKAVAIAWLRLYAGEEDMYKITLRWVQNHILLNTNKAPVEASVHRFKKTNDLLPWCPCPRLASSLSLSCAPPCSRR